MAVAPHTPLAMVKRSARWKLRIIEKCLPPLSSAMIGSARGVRSGEGGLEAAQAGFAGGIFLGLGGHGLGVEIIAVLVEGMRPFRADETVDGAEPQDLPGVLREIDGLELAVVALHPNFHGRPSLVDPGCLTVTMSVSTAGALVPTPSWKKRVQPERNTRKNLIYPLSISAPSRDPHLPGKTFPRGWP